MKKDRSIITTCPCCKEDLVIDLDSGEVFPGHAIHIPDEMIPPKSGITVVHATPEFHQYRDPTHYKQPPLITPLTAWPPATAADEAGLSAAEGEELRPEPPTKEDVEMVRSVSRSDWADRGFSFNE